MKKLYLLLLSIFLSCTTLHAGDPTEDLFQAVKSKDYALVIDAVKKGAQVNAVDALGNTPLHYATDLYYVEEINDNRTTDDIMIGILSRVKEPVSEWQIEADKDLVNRTNKIIAYLLTNERTQAKNTVTNNRHVMPIDNAIRSSALNPTFFNEITFELLMENLNNDKVIAELIFNFYEKSNMLKPKVDPVTLSWLLSFSEADPNYRTYYQQRTMLFPAVIANDDEGAKIMLMNGAKKDLADVNGKTPSSFAKDKPKILVLFNSEHIEMLSYKISDTDMNEAKGLLTGEIKMAHKLLDANEFYRQLNVLYKYSIYSAHSGDDLVARLANSTLEQYWMDLSDKQRSDINGTRKAYLTSPVQQFNEAEFRKIAKDILFVKVPKGGKENIDKLPLSEVVSFVMDELVFTIEQYVEFNRKNFSKISSDNTEPFTNLRVSFLLGPNGLISYFMEKQISLYTVGSSKRTGFATAVMLLNELAKFSSGSYIANNTELKTKSLEVDIFAKKEQELDPKFREVYSRVKEGKVETLFKEFPKMKSIY